MLYKQHHEKDNCGFGLIAHIDGKPSHKVVRTAIHGLARMQHRGAILADGKTGDGCGLLLQKPNRFFHHVAQEKGWRLAANYAVGMLFLSANPQHAQISRHIVEQELLNETLSIVGWREVPIDPDVLGEIAFASLPRIEQVFINAPAGWSHLDFERRLYMVRRRIEKRVQDDDFYVCSLSNQVIIYKGLCMPKDLPCFYLDLADLRMESAICLFHQRFSTNTVPRWPLAQPFRHLAHNGEINTIEGNRQWAKARAYKFKTPLIPDLHDAMPFVNETGSDSSSLDNMLELFLVGGMDIVRAMRLLVPPAWQQNPDMNEDLRAFFDFNSMHMEPWDGPAGIVMSDGRYAACNLDRNGLRPARYIITSDNLITCASEVGIWDYQPDEVVEKGRVGPGELLVIDTQNGKILHSAETDNDLQRRHPYKVWMTKNVKQLIPFEQLADEPIVRDFSEQQLLTYHKQFGYSFEELDLVIRPLGNNGQEATGSMGDDAPFAVLSSRKRLIYDYFRQKFAQVTNPPIDPLREAHVMSLATSIGREMNVFVEAEGQAHRVAFKSPILVPSDFKQLLALESEYYQHDILDITYDIDGNLQEALEAICAEAEGKVRNGSVLIILSDKNIAPDRLPIPAPMAVGAVQRHLVEQNLRCDANIIVETASARDPHHFAVLIGFGATAIYPYLAYETLAHLVDKGAIKEKSYRQVILNYRNGINKGLYKIMSKMGISTIASYRCSKLFEAVGLHETVVECCFAGVDSRISGADFSDFEQDLFALSTQAWAKHKALEQGGLLKFVYGGEYHAYNPDVVQSLQKAVNSGSYQDYKCYAEKVNQRPVAMLRDLLKINPPTGAAIAIEQVESEQELFKRFDSAAMSIGALSPEAHESLAEAMNTLGGFSNSGEGGEDPARYNSIKVSRIKQVASGRFGVTPSYLMSADVIQIKVAQGAKPGEGGQLPGDKVTPYIARLRYSVPGVTLISPPPHHDIYSIEDLAQLIFDLKQINPHALISVKLVSEPGVGTIATGVAKAYADMITISGYDGGTGASPLTSVKYAGSPWELGLVETQQALVSNGLRHKIRLQVDGGLKTGQDIVKAAILGAESFGFGTGPMVALGCKYLRICHLNNCATGVATQEARLRRDHYHGLPEKAMNYFRFIARETREIMAELGVSHIVDLIGRTDLLVELNGMTTKQQKLDLSGLLRAAKPLANNPVYCTERNPAFDKGKLNQMLIQQTKFAVDQQQPQQLQFTISNIDRSVGATLSGYIAQQYGEQGIAATPIHIDFTGTAGQSFGVWNANGLNLTLTGDANDYVGKGMAGGQIVIRPPLGALFAHHESTIVGNTCLYGATGGKLFAAGSAGERFAVRNSGALAVVEGIGDNGCEYMTGGVVCVLGHTGVNFGAGMTGGFAYVCNEQDKFTKRVNTELVELIALTTVPKHEQHLQQLITEHAQLTHSTRAADILANWAHYRTQFVLVKPKANQLSSLLTQRGTSDTTLTVKTLSGR